MPGFALSQTDTRGDTGSLGDSFPCVLRPLLCLPSVTVVTAVHIFATIFLYILVTLEIFTLAFDILFFIMMSLCVDLFLLNPLKTHCLYKSENSHFFFNSGKFSTKLCVPCVSLWPLSNAASLLSPSQNLRHISSLLPPLNSPQTSLLVVSILLFNSPMELPNDYIPLQVSPSKICLFIKDPSWSFF